MSTPSVNASPSPPPPSPSPSATDEQLLARFARGDSAALGLLAERYEAALVGLARAILSGRADLANDAVQESWVRVIKHAKGFANQSTVKTWLYRIVINRCKDLRDAQMRSEHLARSASMNGALNNNCGHQRASHAAHDDPALPPFSPSPDVFDSLDRHAELHVAMDTLSSASRLLLLLCYHHDLTHPQVAEILAIPVGTVKSRLSAALAQLRAQLREEAAP